MDKVLLVFVGGGVGSLARYGLGVALPRPGGWPMSTFTANVVGGLLIGLLAGWLAFRGEGHQERWQLLLQVGFLGGFTTFSSFSLETALMIEKGRYLQAGAYASLSSLLAISAVFVGLFLARRAFA